ncbi:benzoate 1,2-dioxygenase small subunit [Pseudomonas sp. NW5]|uniref:benzoate 1,2-dioxygenase small subunit n=1 Tax=Pseudomonas sp. NW5 TaxID=2934934 RepID=UPI002021AD35|nr:benzoate 1,2-dioxygenase small subunit [Pseudomonas sp. NW5]MCL7461339.1 benzoate 1,2-dioxygenase small subunit [Pseudomonas sp. NW5]
MSMSYEAIRDFLYREARYLDDKQFDEWLELYAPSATFWMPCWDDNDELVENPQTEISLIWYGNRGGLEDRVFRIKTERSSASIPDTRTSHNINNIEVVEQGEGFVKVRFNWHTLSFRYKVTDHFFGTSFYTIDTRGANPLITEKKVVLKNDYVRQVIDIYHL